MNGDRSVRFPALATMTVVAHTVTYFLIGVLASSLLGYAEQFRRPELACWMRPLTDHMVTAGPLFQPVRGFIFALVFFPVREILFARRTGWLITWWMLVGLGILGTFGPAPGSVEGMVYTAIPLRIQIGGWLEVVPQAFLLSATLWYWVRHPHTRWLSWMLGATFAIVMLLSVMGLLFASTTRP